MSKLEHLFNPRTIAMVGIPQDPTAPPRHGYLGGHLHSGYEGKLYVVHPKGGDFMGVEVVPTLAHIPGPVDYAICCLRAELVPQLARDCVAKGVKVLQINSAGFSETAEKEGTELEAELARVAREGNLRAIGPNCMGIYCPKTGLTFMPDFPMDTGSVGFATQSGGYAVRSVRQGASRGIRFSKVISYGNAVDLDECDLLEYLAQDAETEIIGVYIEGVKDGQRFLRVLKRAAEAKPTIVLKGGRSQASSQVVASHTGALAGSKAGWETAIRQAGAIRVEDLNELLDTFVAFQLVQPPKGRRIGVVGFGGANSVQAADDLDQEGFVLPPYPATVKEELMGSKFFSGPGSSYANPMDTAMMLFGRSNVQLVLDTVAQLDDIDCMLVIFAVDMLPLTMEPVQHGLTRSLEAILEFAKSSPKPLMLVIPPPYVEFGLKEKVRAAGVPLYPTTGEATKALARVMSYREAKAQREA
jgi:acyl-CoA synthetase (NDP forming)